MPKKSQLVIVPEKTYEWERRWKVRKFDRSVLDNKKEEIDQMWTSLDSTGKRVRIIDGLTAELAYKRGNGMIREEIEVDEQKDISVKAAQFFFIDCKYYVRKTRYFVDGWHLDVYKDELKGTVTAEYEGPDCPRIVVPSWFKGREVTDTLTSKKLAIRAYKKRGRKLCQITF